MKKSLVVFFLIEEIYQLHDREVFRFRNLRKLPVENVSQGHTYRIEIDIPNRI